MSQAQETRVMILRKAFALIYKRGYQATSIDDIVATTSVTKGAFFYHFPNKEKLGLALINEVMYPGLIPYMSDSLNRSGDVRKDIYDMMSNLLLKAPFIRVEYGCPAVNLIEEMAPLNESFRKALTRIIKEWQGAIEAAFIKAQHEGQLAATHNPKQMALYITANYSGVRNLGKIFGKSAYVAFLREFKNYIDEL